MLLWLLICTLSLLDTAVELHWLLCSVVDKSCFQLACVQTSRGCTLVPHRGSASRQGENSYHAWSFY